MRGFENQKNIPDGVDSDSSKSSGTDVKCVSSGQNM